jgi:rod shape-determining protein MreD
MGDRRPKLEQRIAAEILWAIGLVSLALLDTALAPTIWRFRVDWVLIFAIGWTLLYGLLPGLRIAVYGGVALDLLGSSLLGMHLLGLLVCVMGVALVAEPLDREGPLPTLAVILVATSLYGAIQTSVLILNGVALPLPAYLLVELLPTGLINTIVAIPTVAALRRWVRRRQPAAGLEWS